MLRPGAVASRPPSGRSQSHSGVHPISALTHRTQRFQPLPPPLGEPPYHIDLATILPGIEAAAAQFGTLVLHTVGDTGGIKNGQFQADVAGAMKTDLNRPDGQRPAFFYHLGDIVYFNGEIGDYYAQFYDPYNHYDPPIIGIPGNHDGDPGPTSTSSLDGWVRYFMSPKPQVRPESGDAPRVTQSLPNPYFTLTCPFATIVGMYTNVPEGGSIDSIQQQWLTNEFATAPRDKALILALHHPVYSFDDHHSGSPLMADAVQHAINDSRRVPNLVLTGHVHNYQRIERPIAGAAPTPFLVAGFGGYYHLHGLNAGVGTTDPATKASLLAADDTHHGYVILTITATQIRGEMFTVSGIRGQGVASGDTFTYPTAANVLDKKTVVSL